MALSYIPLTEINRIKSALTDPQTRSAVLATLFRINTLYMIAQAGSGHLGSSFSAMDIVTWLWTAVMNDPNNDKNPNHDVYFSSKGHDAPGLYSILLGLEKLPFEKIHTLRRFNGLPGHPDVVRTPGLATNTGSLGMGVAKARGMALARRLNNQTGRFYVLTGDGELQEGQNWESLQPTANRKYANITVIVDHNKMQSDTWVKNVSDLGDLEKKFAAFGWDVQRIDGHDLNAIAAALQHCQQVTDRPQIIIADTIKGKGVSFMQSTALGEEESLYKFHSGAPSEDNYGKALAELLTQANAQLAAAKLEPLQLESYEMLPRYTPSATAQKLVPAYGDELLKLAGEHQDLIALDADLMLDTGLIPFKDKYPDRFIECGIAEQDMVSSAGGLALAGKLPVVHSFACFLTTRPNEQIYNNATEGRKIIYAGSLSGVLPAGPGHSHQSVRDISILGAIPGLTLVSPVNEAQARQAIRWAVKQNKYSTYIRLESLAIDLPEELLTEAALTLGMGHKVNAGIDLAIVAYGPTLLKQAVLAAQDLAKQGKDVAVYNFPWLNTIADEFVAELSAYKQIITLDNHYVQFGQGVMVAAALQQHGAATRCVTLGLTEVPRCGQNDEVLAYHKLDAASLVEQVNQVE